MSEKFRNKYRIPSSRLQNWDYGSNAIYFVTICTQGRNHFFGKIEKEEMILSEVGKIVENFWNKIPEHFTFVELGDFIVMPNHIHGIIIICKNQIQNSTIMDVAETANLAVSTMAIKTDSTISKRTMAATQKWKPSTLGVIINQFKRICTINVRKIAPDFFWQSNYHDNIIRDYISYIHISEYIKSNPAKWNDDEFYK
jgi:REP element-mobilizing transposase RayT